MSGHRYPPAKGGGGMSSLARRWRLLSVQAFGRSGPLVLSRVASAALTFGLPLVLVRVLDPHSFGTYKQFFLVAQTRPSGRVFSTWAMTMGLGILVSDL